MPRSKSGPTARQTKAPNSIESRLYSPRALLPVPTPIRLRLPPTRHRGQRVLGTERLSKPENLSPPPPPPRRKDLGRKNLFTSVSINESKSFFLFCFSRDYFYGANPAPSLVLTLTRIVRVPRTRHAPGSGVGAEINPSSVNIQPVSSRCAKTFFYFQRRYRSGAGGGQFMRHTCIESEVFFFLSTYRYDR